MREDYYAGLEDRYFLTFDQAKDAKLKIDFDTTPPAPAPRKLGITVIDDVTVADVVPCIDWVGATLPHLSHHVQNTNLTQSPSPSFLESLLSNLGTPWSLSQSWLSKDFQ